MGARVFGLCLGVTLLAGPSTGCSLMVPGNEGWECKTSADCKDGRRCRTYQFKGRDHTRRYCTGRKALTSNKQTYNWFLLVAAWVMLLGLPLAVVVLVVVARIKARKQGPGAPGAGGAPPMSGAPPNSGAPPGGGAAA